MLPAHLHKDACVCINKLSCHLMTQWLLGNAIDNALSYHQYLQCFLHRHS